MMKSNFNEQRYFKNIAGLVHLLVKDTKAHNKSDVREDMKRLKLETHCRDKMLISSYRLNSRYEQFFNQIINGGNSMKKYVKKPIPIHAFRWDGKVKTLGMNITIKDFNKYFIVNKNSEGNANLKIRSMEGLEDCPLGDYVIRGIHGEYYPCDPKIFKESYKEVK